MQSLDAFWHLLNFFAPALGVGLFTPTMAKVLWRRGLKTASWWRLSMWATGASAISLVLGLAHFGHDGWMATYGAMLLACASTVWIVGFAPHRSEG